MHSEQLQSHLRSWLGNRLGTSTVQAKSPQADVPVSVPNPERFTWLEIAAEKPGVPGIAGIRPITSTAENRCFEFVEWFNSHRVRRTYWRLDRFGAWESVIDI